MKTTPLISIIIRAKNEEKWISSCLNSLFRQDLNNFEVILVDNCSVDRTIEKAQRFPISKIVSINEFFPGKALNLGIQNSRGKYLVCLSAHCIPVNTKWLKSLLDGFEKDTAGVYGRQEPMAFTRDVDKRDLINIFGLDKKVQKKDPFFHNANSMIRKNVWETFPFSETATNIEDRLWAMEILKHGYNIIYEPDASVYHYHGINQGRNIERAKSVVCILEEFYPTQQTPYNDKNLNISVIIPVKAPVKKIGNISLLEVSIKAFQQSKFINHIIVAADNQEHLAIAESMNAEGIYRPEYLSYSYIELIKVYQYILESKRISGDMPDIVFLAEEKFPFRTFQIIDKMIEQFQNSDSDSVIAAQPIYNTLWRANEESMERIDNGFMPTKFKDPICKSLYGLGAVMYSGLLLQGKKLGSKTGLFLVDDPYNVFSVSSTEEQKIAQILYPAWKQYNEKRGVD